MSLKVYEAYRVPLKNLNDYIAWAREACLDRAADHVRKATPFVEDDAIPKPNEHVTSRGPRALEEYDFRKRCDHILKLAQIAHRSPYKEAFDLSCSINVWIRGRFAYITPIGPWHITEVLEDPPEYVDEYGYWNNTDRPDEISAAQWRARARVWNAIFTHGNDHNQLRLNHEIITMDDRLFGFWDLARKLGRFVGTTLTMDQKIVKREIDSIRSLLETVAMVSRDADAVAEKISMAHEIVAKEAARQIREHRKG